MYTLRKKCPYSKFFWSVFFRVWIEYSVQMRENTDEKNSEYRQVLRSILYQNNIDLVYLYCFHLHTALTCLLVN